MARNSGRIIGRLTKRSRSRYLRDSSRCPTGSRSSNYASSGGKGLPEAHSASGQSLFSDSEVLLFWQWIRRKVCVDQHPLVALFHIDAGRFCTGRFRLSILVLGDADIVVSQDGDIPVVDLDLGIGHFRRDGLASGFSRSFQLPSNHSFPVETRGIIAVELGVVIRH